MGKIFPAIVIACLTSLTYKEKMDLLGFALIPSPPNFPQAVIPTQTTNKGCPPLTCLDFKELRCCR